MNIKNIHTFNFTIKGVLVMNPYAEVLKQLLQYTETKYTTLSQAIDYDMSYISKWVNGTRLPASRHADRIHEDMARFFADTAQKQHQEDDLNRIFSFADDGQDLAFHLYGLLSQAYRQAQIKTEKMKTATKLSISMPAVRTATRPCASSSTNTSKASRLRGCWS